MNTRDDRSKVTAALILGCGDIGRRVAALERAAGARVSALARSAERAEELKASGLVALRGDLDDPATLQELSAEGALLYYLAPPPASGVTDPRIETALARLHGTNLPQRVVLISTTGVYGDCGGAWIDEDRPPNPQTDRSKRRLAAEDALRRWSAATGVPAVILRVPGIYGPGRLPVARIARREPVVREAEAPFTNRIHASDLAQTCFLAGRREHPGALYNISDGHPTTMTDYFNRVADLLALPRPPALPLDEARHRLSAGMLSYLTESRRLDNRRMREELGVDLQYPDLALGLPACLED
jgi:nucleoside-diphosphate-sugar epimerase